MKKRRTADQVARGTDQRNGGNFDQHDGSIDHMCMFCGMIGACAPFARHAAKNAESHRTGNGAWQSWARTGRPGIRAR